MNFRTIEFSPQTTPRSARLRSTSNCAASVGPGDIGFLRSWFEHDYELDEVGLPRQINWDAISGLLLALAISAGFWTGLGLFLQRVWK